ncbi:MAG: peptidoglycan DD-metalloendopeptidase family protein [Candidatus Falkowbacteria bacterium]|nr:peptidoglycan DD-metalloendopeptidase family protein [Candidatus Falkowbacteria bacterium]
MEPENGQPKNRKLAKATIDFLLNTVKFLLFLKKSIALVVNLLVKFTTWILRLTLKRPLVRIYYWIFRFRKEGLIENSVFDIVRKKLPHFIIALLVLISFISNLGQPTKISAVTEKMTKTTIAQLVSGEFSNLEQESMITETLNPNSIHDYANDKYSHDQGVLTNEIPVTDDNIDYNEDQFVLERNVDYLSKPQLLGSENGGTNINSAPTPETQKRTSVIYYTIKNGETISAIARSFGLSVNTILWANNLGPNSLIKPDNQLMILPQNGVLYTVVKGDTVGRIARKYDISEADLTASNNLGGNISIGQKIIIPGGRRLVESTAPTQTPKTNSYTGISVIKDLVKAPVSKVSGGGTMLWPTVGHRITQYYSWRHTAVDIANKVGTPLYAAADGVVEFAGWSTGYGNNVVINHGGGKKTRYAHASKLFVTVGQEVERGENIAAMGSTGWSTGPHIHFEVMINGVKYNPLNYIK